MRNRVARGATSGAGLKRRAAHCVVVLLGLGVALASVAAAEERIARPGDWLTPRAVFFNDYFLFSAQRDVMTMTAAERVALDSLLGTCADTLAVGETPRLRCDLARLRYLMSYRQSRPIDRLLDAVQFMTIQFAYNVVIGRENEAGINGRLGAIHTGLRSAVSLSPILVDDPTD
jgi:hypothetical protein